MSMSANVFYEAVLAVFSCQTMVSSTPVNESEAHAPWIYLTGVCLGADRLSFTASCSIFSSLLGRQLSSLEGLWIVHLSFKKADSCSPWRGDLEAWYVGSDWVTSDLEYPRLLISVVEYGWTFTIIMKLIPHFQLFRLRVRFTQHTKLLNVGFIESFCVVIYLMYQHSLQNEADGAVQLWMKRHRLLILFINSEQVVSLHQHFYCSLQMESSFVIGLVSRYCEKEQLSIAASILPKGRTANVILYLYWMLKL